MSLRLRKKQIVILGLIAFLLLGSGTGFAIWYLNNRDDIAPDDSAAGICCNSFVCADGTPFGHDTNYEGSSNCEHREVVCQERGGVAERGNQCGTASCGGIGQACCAGNGCSSSLSCIGGLCMNEGDSCGGSASCDNSGCYCNPAENGCNPVFAQFHCLITGPNSNQIPVSCNDANDSPEAQAQNNCKTIQYDVSQCNGSAANVVWIDEDGTACSSNDGGLNTCLARADFSLDGCAPKSCTVTHGFQCLDDGQVRVNWSASPSGFGFGPNEGRVVVRLDNLDDPWFTQGTDTWWSTHNQEFVDSGRNPANGSWDFPVESGVQYNVRVSVDPSATNANTEGLCSTAELPFTCNSNNAPECSALSSSSASVQNGDTITLTANVSDQNGNLEDVAFYWAEAVSDSGSNYCSNSDWTLIGSATSASGSLWTYTWNVSGIPSDGAIVVSAVVEDDDGAWCSGNPSGSCSTTAEPCPNCAITLGVSTPICTDLSLSGSTVQNGSTVTINMNVSDSDSEIESIPIYWALATSNNNYCTNSQWTMIGEATVKNGSTWTYTWNVSGLPTEGEIVIAANPGDGDNTFFCTGNPSGSCNTGILSCPTCNERVTIAAAFCGGACSTDAQCGNGMQCVSGMCRNSACPQQGNCNCLPSTAIFDSTQSKIIVGFILISLSAAYMLYDGFDRITLKIYNEASQFDIQKTIKRRKRKVVEERRSQFEERVKKD